MKLKFTIQHMLWATLAFGFVALAMSAAYRGNMIAMGLGHCAVGDGRHVCRVGRSLLALLSSQPHVVPTDSHRCSSKLFDKPTKTIKQTSLTHPT